MVKSFMSGVVKVVAVLLRLVADLPLVAGADVPAAESINDKIKRMHQIYKLNTQ